jgi:manganese/zinc/iron transport system substrate-binding protein
MVVFSTLAGCGSQQSSGDRTDGSHGSSGNRTIVCTTGMVADIVRQVVGDRYNVVGLMGEGVDPHLYKPTTSDTAQLSEADVIFYNGLMLEGPMQHPLEALARNGKLVSAVTAEIPKQKLRTPEGFEGHPDPHVWMDVSLWSLAVESIVATMSEYDTEHAETFRSNADSYLEQLTALDEYARESIGTIPQTHRYLVTAHDAFSYFSEAYGIQVESVQGITTESDPGVDDVIRLVDLLVSKKIPALFVESSVNEDNLRAVLEAAQKKGWTVRTGGTLYSDAMGTKGTYEGTYIGMIDHNVTTITRALGGDVPAAGLNGKLSGVE